MNPRLAFFLALALLSLGIYFRAPLLSRDELHVDEALYADVSRHVIERADILVNGAKSDKPPLLYWMQAPAMLLFGMSEFSARLQGLFSWLLAAAFVWVLLSKAWGRESALGALAFWCLSPYGILFTPTGFTDGLMASCGMIGLALLAAGNFWAAGFSLGLALASKQTGLLYLGPAILMLAGSGGFRRFSKGYAWVLIPLLIWSAVIANPKFGIWSRAAEYASAGAETTLAARWQGILGMAKLAGGGLWANVLCAALLLYGLFSKSGRIAALSVFGYLAFLAYSHGRFYDRYLIWALPLLALACGAGLARIPRALQGAVLIAVAVMMGLNWNPNASFGGNNQGFREAKAFCDGNLKAGDKIYLAGQAKPLGWKALFYFHPGKGQGLQQAEIASLSEAKERGWVLAFEDDLSGRPPDFNSGKGLVIWKTHGL